MAERDAACVVQSDERDGLLPSSTDATVFNPVLSTTEKLLFFMLGLAPVLGWNCIFVSEAYFYETLGPAVLSRLGLCQNLCSLAVQFVLLALRKEFVFFVVPIGACLAYMTGLCVVYLAVPLSSLHAWHLYLFQCLNGAATGVAQTQLGCMGGLYGKAGQCGALLFAGNSLGALLPPTVQVVALLAHGTGGHSLAAMEHINRQISIIVFVLGAVGSLAGIASIGLLARTANYRHLTTADCMECNEDFKSLGMNPDVSLERWAVATVRSTQACIVVTRALWLFLLALTPYVATAKDTPFWAKNLATMLIASTCFGDFCGRLLGNHVSLENMKALVAAVASRVAFVVVTLLYLNVDGFVSAVGSDNVFVIILYFAMSFTHRYLVVALQTKSQTACGFYPGEDSCPLISQMSWLASQTGLVVGIAFSFIPVS